jgi:hypothetical protein
MTSIESDGVNVILAVTNHVINQGNGAVLSEADSRDFCEIVAIARRIRIRNLASEIASLKAAEETA